MRILWVKAGKLLPVDTGGKIRSYNLLTQLAARHEVVLLSYYSGVRDPVYERDLRDRFPGAAVIYTGAAGGPLHYAGRLAWRAPYAVSKFTSPEVRRAVAQRLGDGSIDVA